MVYDGENGNEPFIPPAIGGLEKEAAFPHTVHTVPSKLPVIVVLLRY